MKSINKTILVFSLCFTAIFLFGDSVEKHLMRAYKSIQPMDAYQYCKTIASPEYAGRHTGHEGYTAVARWVAQKFRDWDLKPIDDKSGYLQEYPSPYVIVDQGEMTLAFPESKKKSEERFAEPIPLQPGKDFLPLLFSDSGDKTAALVFVGWGISAPDLDYDDYAGVDVQDKFVVCFRGTPDPQNKKFQKHDHHRFRMMTAKKKGAFGLLYIYDEVGANPNGDWIEDFMPAKISKNVADMILKEKGLTADRLKKDLLKYRKPLSFPLQSNVHLRVKSRYFPDAKGYNVAGYVEGSDPRLKKECLVFGAHLDHCGQHMGLLFAGADDNASGSAAVMEIAEAFSLLKIKPKRSVVFVLFGGEEMGLQGSNYFANHCPSRFVKIDSMFNFDMVGEGDGVAYGYSTEELNTFLKEADQNVQIIRYSKMIREVGVRSSDFAPFFLKGAACISFYSNGPHLYYHQTGDTIYRINPEIMADIAKLTFIAGYRWANR